MNAIARPASRCGMSCPVVDMAPASMDGKAFTATLDRFGHNRSGGGQLMHAVHTSGHTVSSFSLKRQLGYAALSAPARWESVSASLSRPVVSGSRCLRAPPVSAPVMAV